VGNAFFWDHWIRISAEARSRWLGLPNRAGAIIPDHGGMCDACFEDTHQLHWLPQFQPIRGHFWMLRHVTAGHDWVRAEKDAPWHPETSLRLDIRSTYERVRVGPRIDWWVMEYSRHHRQAVIIGLVLIGGLLGGVLLWSLGGRTARRRRSEEAADQPPVSPEERVPYPGQEPRADRREHDLARG